MTGGGGGGGAGSAIADRGSGGGGSGRGGGSGTGVASDGKGSGGTGSGAGGGSGAGSSAGSGGVSAGAGASGALVSGSGEGCCAAAKTISITGGSGSGLGDAFGISTSASPAIACRLKDAQSATRARVDICRRDIVSGAPSPSRRVAMRDRVMQAMATRQGLALKLQARTTEAWHFAQQNRAVRSFWLAWSPERTTRLRRWGRWTCPVGRAPDLSLPARGVRRRRADVGRATGGAVPQCLRPGCTRPRDNHLRRRREAGSGSSRQCR